MKIANSHPGFKYGNLHLRLWKGATVYVPMAFVGQSLGAKVSWDQQAKQAIISMNDKQIVVRMDQPAGQITAAQMISESQLKVLSEQLNKAATLSFVKSLFAPPVTSVIYTSKTTATITQSVIFGNDMTGEENYVYDRLANFVYANGLWKVNQVNFTFRTIPNLGY
ncbi:stalk domain-containing protein [Paenibacillus ihuae]|uniref:stalk domain-containing protein n=1 Tax=Paenibacillus ihuae TaxID=1232431 RepID=UPI001AE06B01|nr:stalk domain-containing protein [Paenibacillus ihuae]